MYTITVQVTNYPGGVPTPLAPVTFMAISDVLNYMVTLGIVSATYKLSGNVLGFWQMVSNSIIKRKYVEFNQPDAISPNLKVGITGFYNDIDIILRTIGFELRVGPGQTYQ